MNKKTPAGSKASIGQKFLAGVVFSVLGILIFLIRNIVVKPNNGDPNYVDSDLASNQKTNHKLNFNKIWFIVSSYIVSIGAIAGLGYLLINYQFVSAMLGIVLAFLSVVASIFVLKGNYSYKLNLKNWLSHLLTATNWALALFIIVAVIYNK